MSILVLGIGNPYMSDDSIGVRVVQRLQREFRLSPEVRVVDGGTLGIKLLSLLEGVERLLVVDAVRNGSTPGTLIRLAGDQVPRAFMAKLSRDEAGLSDLLAAAELLGTIPWDIVLWGIQPASLEFGEQLSPLVAAQFETLVNHVLDELAKWGQSGN
jgi:hydrogenase maturation protease